MLETDLYPPVKQHFETQGYAVQAEVKDCDIVATSDTGELVVVELKTSANLGLLIQATARQAITANVYIAIPKKTHRRKQWLGIQRVVKQLGLGLLVVSITPLTTTVSELFPPQPMRKIVKRKRDAVVKEVGQRILSYNIGGSTRSELMTAYKQHAIILGCFLQTLGEATPAELRALDNPKNTQSILANNHYGWFNKIRRGVYQLDKDLFDAPARYPELWQTAQTLVEEKLNN